MPKPHEVTVDAVEALELKSGDDVVRLRGKVRERAIACGFSLVDQTKVITAASELGRNMIQYGGGGQVRIASLSNVSRKGLRIEFADQGPGIPDLALALKDGYTSGSGLGLGLSGARRLSDEFHIESEPGQGTRVTIARWKPF